MGKKRRTGTCILCLRESNELTDEHVFPSAWYPETTPDNMEKWKVPSCNRCNHEYSKVEDRLLSRLGLGINMSDARASGIGEKALRGFDPRYARNERDRRARQSRRAKLLKEVAEASKLSDEGFFPNFGPKPGHSPRYKFLLDKRDLEGLVEKLVRGTTYRLDSALILPSHSIEAYFSEESKIGEVIDLMKRHAVTYHRGPGILVQRARLNGDPRHALFRFEIWGRLILYAVVRPRESEGS